jgi:hypothetical protein
MNHRHSEPSVDPVYPGDEPPAEAIEAARREAGDEAARKLLRLLYAADERGVLILRAVLQHITAPTASVTEIARRLGTSRKNFYAHQRRVQAAIGNTRAIGKNAVSR